MNNKYKLNSNGNQTNRGHCTSESWHAEKSASSQGFSRFSTEHCRNSKGRTSPRGSSEFDSTIQQKTSFSKRNVTNEDICPKKLTLLFRTHKTLLELKNLYNGQKDKPYFNFIHAHLCFSQAIKVIIKFSKHKIFTAEELSFFKDSIISYSKDLNAKAFNKVIRDSMDLLAYTKSNGFQGHKEVEALALNVLSSIFNEINIRETILRNFELQPLTTLLHNAVKFLDYTQDNHTLGVQEAGIQARNLLSLLFKEINARNNFMQLAQSQDIPDLFNVAMQLLEHTRNKSFEGTEELELHIFSYLFQEVNNRENFQDFDSQTLTNLTNALINSGNWNNSSSELLAKIAKNICMRDSITFSVQDLCSLAGSFSIGKELSSICDWLIKALSTLSILEIEELTLEDVKQLYIAFLSRAHDCKIWNKNNPDAFLRVYLETNLIQTILEKLNKETEKYYLKVLESQKTARNALKNNLLEDCSLKEEGGFNPYPINFTILKDEKLIALIDINGPWKYMCNAHSNLIREFKEKLLQNMGYSAIININFNKDDSLKNQEKLLKQKLSNVFDLDNKDAIILIDYSKQKKELKEFHTRSLKNTSEKTKVIPTSSPNLEVLNPIVIEIPVKKPNIFNTRPSYLNTEIQSPVIENFGKQHTSSKIVSSNHWVEIKSKKLASKKPIIEQMVLVPKTRPLPSITTNPEATSNISSSFHPEVKKSNTVANKISKKQNNSLPLVSKKDQSATTPRSDQPLTALESIRSYATSIPAIAVYLILLIMSFNPMQYWNSERQ